MDIVDNGSDAAPEIAAGTLWSAPARVRRWRRIRHEAELHAAHRWAARAAGRRNRRRRA